MTYIDFTYKLLAQSLINDNKILLLAPHCSMDEFFLEHTNERLADVSSDSTTDIIRFETERGAYIDVLDSNFDFFDILDGMIKETTSDFKYSRYDIIIASRILEHIEFRKLDWFIALLSYNMKPNGLLHVIVPDMSKAAEEIFQLMEQPVIDSFKLQRLNFEIFNEGSKAWDRHATWTDRATIKYYLEREGLFKVEAMQSIYLDGSKDVVSPNIHVIAKRTK